MRNHSSPSSLPSPPRRFSSPPRGTIIYGDRFIPSRISSQLDSGLISVNSPDSNIENENRPIHSLIRSELLGHPDVLARGRNQNTGTNVLRFQSSVEDIQRYSSHASQSSSPAPVETDSISNSPSYRMGTSMPTMGTPNRMSNSFEPSSTSLGGSAKKPKRKISRTPYKVLDAPSLQDDFYLNLVDWSKSNILAVALGNSVYMWSAYTSKVVKLHDFSLPDSDTLPGGSVTSVCWMNGGTHIAVGTSCGRIQVWDAAKSVKVRELQPHGGRVGSLAWNQQYCLVASGSKDKSIFLQDSRVRGAFTPSRHLGSSKAQPMYPTPQRASHPIHSDSPDRRLHHPILASRPLSTQPSPAVYSSPQRILASMNDVKEDGNDEDDEDEFVERYLRDSPAERSVRRRQTLSPSAPRRSNGMPPRPPSLPGTVEKRMVRKFENMHELPSSRSVFGSDSDDMQMNSDSDNEEVLDIPQDLDPEFGNESPVLKVFEEMEEQRSETKSVRSQGLPSDSTIRKLEFFDDDIDASELLQSPVADSIPFATPPRSSPSTPSILSDFLRQPTYLPQYASPNSNSLFSSNSQMDIVEDSASSPCVINELLCHKQEVCGLRWSFDDKQLASGGNDNKLFIWNISGMSFNERNQQKRDSAGNHRNQILVPEHQFVDHTAAVKAIAWSPHQHGLLVSGGGTADRHMRFWNAQTGLPLQALDTGSQVCNLMWSTYSNELVSTHGYSLNQIAIWKYPSLQKLATLTGHTYRVLYLAMSPNGQSIVTGAGDETLRFWNVFPGSKTPLSGSKGMLLHSGGEIR